MSFSVNIKGIVPDSFTECFDELSNMLDMQRSNNDIGTTIEFFPCGEFKIEKDLNNIKIYYAKNIQIWRGLSYVKQLINCDTSFEGTINQNPCFDTLGVMVDASRNAVMHVGALKDIIKKFSLMGVNLIMLYTEDTYEVPEYPYFGYMRGRYTYEELKELDDYAFKFGIEMCPCIQTLGHLNRAIRWPKMYYLSDTEEVLLTDSEETYEFLEKAITAATRPYRSKRVHIGMDEAHGIGLGTHLKKHGYENPHTIIKRHLKRVVEITDKLGLDTMMWSDMYFRPDSVNNLYYDSVVSQSAIDSVLPNVELVYWDYYHNKQSSYDEMFDKHRQLGAKTAFAGAIWVFGGPAPDYDHTLQNTIPALNSCLKNGTKTVLATAWGDNGAEANITTILPGVQFFAEFCYTQDSTISNLKKRFETCCDANFDAFWKLTDFNRVEGMKSGEARPVNAAKMLLYQDPLIQLYAEDFKGIDIETHYKKLVEEYENYAQSEKHYALLYKFYASLAKIILGKCHWNNCAKTIVVNKDYKEAQKLCDYMQAVIKETENFQKIYWELWKSTNNPFGFEVIDGRIGAVRARLITACARLSDFTKGKDEMQELLEPVLEYTIKDDKTIFGSYAIGEIVSACKIDI